MDSAWHKLSNTAAWKRSPNFIKFGIVNFLAHLIAFWGPNFLVLIGRRLRMIQKYKIQKTSKPPAALVWEAIIDNIKGDLIGMPLLAYPLYKLLTSGSATKGKVAIEDPASSDHRQEEQSVDNTTLGWARLQFGKLPSVWTSVWQVSVAYLGYDAMFYWSHRLLHQKAFYMRVHKQHHKFSAPVGHSSSYQHPVEGLIQLLNWYLPIGFAGWLNGRVKGDEGGLHIVTLFAYNCFRWVETFDAHCGYDFPWSPFSFIPLFGGANAHDLHHSAKGLQMVKLQDGTLFADFGNYGASVLWDRLMGTISKGARQ